MAGKGGNSGAIQLNMGHLAALRNKLGSVQKAAEKYKDKFNGVVNEVVDTALVVGTAYGAGVVQGRYGGVILPGDVPLELAAGAGALTASAFGLGGRHTASIGRGLLAAWAVGAGQGQGNRMLRRENDERVRAGKDPEKADGFHLFGGDKEKKDEQSSTGRPSAVPTAAANKDASAGRARGR